MNKDVELFNAIKTKDRMLVHDLATNYKTNIDISATDGEGKSFAHHAAKTGINSIIEDIVINLRCDLSIRDNYGKLATDDDWSGRLKEAIGTRKENEKKELPIKRFKDHEAQVYQEETRRGAYLKGTLFTHNFSLVYGSKKPFKECVIDDVKNETTNLSIHEQQAIVEALTVCHNDKQTVNDLVYPFTLEATNFLVVNIGFVISEGNYTPSGNEHRRKFVSFPFYMHKDRNFANEQHSEDFFIWLLKAKLEAILKGITEGITRPTKVYSIIFDLHSSQDMCDDCEKTVADFEVKYVDKIKNLLSQSGFIVPKGENNNFKILFRVSATRPPSHTAYRQEPHLRSPNEPMVRKYTHFNPMDLKKSEFPLILHSDETMRNSMTKWYNKESYQGNSLFHIPRYSIFENQIGYTNPDLPESVTISSNTLTNR